MFRVPELSIRVTSAPPESTLSVILKTVLLAPKTDMDPLSRKLESDQSEVEWPAFASGSPYSGSIEFVPEPKLRFMRDPSLIMLSWTSK
jgi:hypothetical protein